MTVNVSFIKLENNVTSVYHLTKKHWKNKEVLWTDIYKVMSNSKVQYSNVRWKNGFKTYDNWSNKHTDCLILDIDDGMNIQTFQKRYKDFKYCLATTKSHQKDKKGKVLDRYRIIIPCINISLREDVYFRSIELFCSESDKQVLTRTASFLGNDDAIIIYNEGKILDMYPYNELAEMQLEEERVEKIVIDEDFYPIAYTTLSVGSIKEQLTFHIVVEILSSLGYQVNGNKFKLRDDERTDSCCISYRSLNIKDYGGTFTGDIIDLCVKEQGMSFREALKYISVFL